MTRHAKASSTQSAAHLGLGRRAPLTAFLVLIVAVLALGPASAAAKEVHVLKRSFGQGELSLQSRSGVALNQESGEVYVADTGNSRIAKFTAAGVADGNLATVAEPTFIAVDNSGGSSKGDVYVVNAADNSITKLDALGLPVSGWGTAGHLAGLGEIAGIAVDSSGDLWAYNTESIMRKLSGSTGAQLTEWNSGRGVKPVGIAVDSAENVYMVAGIGATQFSPAGSQIKTIFGPSGEVGALMGAESGEEVYLWGSGPNGERRIERLTSSEQLVESFPTGQSSEVGGLTTRTSTDEVFAADHAADQISVFAFENVEPPTVTIDLPDTVTARTAHFAGHISPNAPSGNPPSYDVTWRFECKPECRGMEGQISADSSEHLVEGTAKGLSPHTHYEVALVAENAGGFAETETLGFTTLPAEPFAEPGFARSVTDTEATLNATIVPNGDPTTYHFDFVPKDAYEVEGFASSQTRSTAEEGPLSADNDAHAVSVRLTGLETNTAYVYRVVAKNSVGSAFWPTQVEEGEGLVPSFVTQVLPPAPETDCPNQIFREFAGASLPDCRAYEQVSPRDKAGLDVEGFQDLLATSPDGSRVSFYSGAGNGIPASGGAHQDFTTLLSSRQGESWSTQRLLPPEQLGTKAGFLGASQDLRYALVETSQRGAPRPYQNGLAVLDTTNSQATQIVPFANQGGSPEETQYGYDGISADGSQIFFETMNQLTTNAAPERDNLYMWDRASGEVSLVGVLPGAAEEAPANGSYGGAYSWFIEPSTDRGGGLLGLYVEAVHAISSDGDQAYFTASQTGQLYLRRGLTGATPATVRVSKANDGVEDPWVEEIGEEYPAAFQEATPDGSRAFFLSSQKLTADATTGEFDEGRDLYRYDTETEALVDITPDSNSEDFNGAEVRGLLGASADGSSGYFVARGVLAEGGEVGSNNLYRFSEEGGGFTITFVARLSGEGDTRNWSPQSNQVGYITPENGLAKTSRVTPNGEALLFSSGRSLTGFNNVGCLESPCREIYLYSAAAESLNCLSCNPSGEKPVGDAQISTEAFNGNLIPTTVTASRLVRSMSADGSRVFFLSPDSLAAADTNGSASCKLSIETPVNSGGIRYCQDVYEWEAPGAPGGSCQKAEVNGGCIYLLSTGKSKEPSFFVDASSDGSSAFIATSSQLVPTDKDELYDIYNVRTDGGSAVQHVTPVVPCSSGEACRGSSSLAPEASSPGTSSFQGPGNPKSGKAKAKKCKKSAHKNCKKKQKKKHQKKKSAKRPNATTRKAGGSK